MRAELAAVVAGGDLDDPRPAAGADAGDRRALDGLQAQAVDDDLVDALDLGGELESTRPRRVGQKAVLVLARSALYLLPTFEPDRAMPPGNGRMTSGTARMAATAASAAASVVGASTPRRMMLPPATPLTVPKVSSQMNSPSITGIRQ